MAVVQSRRLYAYPEVGWTLDGVEAFPEDPPPPEGELYSFTILGKKPRTADVLDVTPDRDLTGSSGGFYSRAHPGKFVTHSDRGTYLYYLDLTAVGGYLPVLKAHRLTGVSVGGSQWEDSSYDAANDLCCVANCGGNTPAHEWFGWRFPEIASLANPGTIGEVAAETFHFQYPGSQAWDCESLAVDPIKGQWFYLTKEDAGVAQLYAAPRTLTRRTAGGSQTNPLTAITSGNWTTFGRPTAADFSADGTELFWRNNRHKAARATVLRDSNDWITGLGPATQFDLPALLNANGKEVTAETLASHPTLSRILAGAEGVETPLAEVIV